MTQTDKKESEIFKDYRISYDDFEKNELCTEAAWLCPERREAFSRFEQKGFPTLKDEAWRYTRLDEVKNLIPQKIPRTTVGIEVIQTYILDLSWPRAVFINGVFEAGLSMGLKDQEGVRCISMAQAIEERLPGVTESFQALTAKSRALTDLNTAFFVDGVYLELDERIRMKQPLQILSLFIFENRESVVNTRNVIRLGRGSQGTLVQTLCGISGKKYFVNEVTGIQLQEDAKLEHYVLRQGESSGTHTARVEAELFENSDYQVSMLSADADFFRYETDVFLCGKGAHVDLKGLYLTQNHEFVDQNFLIEHRVPECTSEQMLKGIVDGASRLVLRGKVFVFKDAQKTAASQSMRALMLSDAAIVDAKPELEIFADDVKCSHGTAIGQIEGDAAFYLQSRGLGTEESRRMLTRAFAMEVIDTMKLECVRNAAEDALKNHFGAV